MVVLLQKLVVISLMSLRLLLSFLDEMIDYILCGYLIIQKGDK